MLELVVELRVRKGVQRCTKPAVALRLENLTFRDWELPKPSNLDSQKKR